MRAIRCFQNQTYERRELLIIADGEDVSATLENNGFESTTPVRYVHINEGSTIGEKRNYGSSRADGKYIVSWDDDDFSAAERVADQIDRIEKAEVAVTGYHSMYFTNDARWWKYSGTQSTNLGTSLCYEKDFWRENEFPRKQVAEDHDFILRAHIQRQYVAVDARRLMVASIHRANTSPRKLLGKNWQEVADPKIKGYESI